MSGPFNAPDWSVPAGEWAGQPCFILGGGPSLGKIDVSRLRGRGHVIAINNAYLLAPWADMLYFGDAAWYEWNKDKLDTAPPLIVTRTQLHVKTGSRLHDVRHIGRDTQSDISRDPAYVAGWCSGANALNMAFLYGADPIFLFGFDMRPGNWHDLHQKPPKAGQHAKSFIPSMNSMERELRGYVRVFNATPGSALACFAMIDPEEVMTMEDLTKIEMDKYVEVWKSDQYRIISPGMQECERAFHALELKAGDRLNDYGSGPARATKWFMDKGISALGIDFAENACEFKNVPIINACLWDMEPWVRTSDYAFCCDVLEHIPPEKLDDVLKGISERTRKSGWIRIHTQPDVMGPRLLGQPLHLIVKSAPWWDVKLREHFAIVHQVEKTSKNVVFAVRNQA